LPQSRIRLLPLLAGIELLTALFGDVSIFDPANAAHASVLNGLVDMRSELSSCLFAGGKMLDGCVGILAIAQGQMSFTEDDMGSE
jgi:hypothetical protein